MALILFTVRHEKLGWPVAIIATSILWSLGHTGTLVPFWMRLVQISSYGILLGILFKREGIEACIISHVISNIALTIIHLNSTF